MINRQMATCLIAFCMIAGVSIASNRTIYSNVKDSTDEKTTAVKQKENNLNGTEKAAKDKEKELPYDQLIKRTGSVQDGLFTIRHIDDKWYFEIADSLLGRYILAVTRFTGVPQSFGKFSGEAINQQTLYFEQRNAKTMLLRAYVLSQEADPNSRISKTLKASTVDPIIASFKIIGRNKTTGAQLTEPIKPIVFYIDPATPKKWVPYLKKGIEDWNVAFEAAGFKNAILAKDFPNDSTMSVDDARFNVLRYLPAEIENAYGPRIVDPRSGEIIESHICWYHNVMNLLTKWYMTQCGPLDKRAQTMKMDDRLMGELIRFVSSHEVGHTLGLRHNMGASHATPVEKLRDKKWVEQHGHTASIMDYARFNYVAQPEDGISERGLFPRINDYDKWAIKWGYQYRPEFKDEMQEKDKLMDETTAILAKNPRLWFGGEGRNEDPRAQTEDLGDDNVRASEYGIKNLKRIIVALPEWTKQPNDQYKDRIEMWQSVLSQFNRYTNHVLKNVGGRYLNNMPGQKPYEVAPAQKGRDAVAYISKQLFDAPLWLYPTTMTDVAGTDIIADINAQQSRVLKVLMNGALLDKMYKDQQAKGAYQFADYLNDVFQAVWKPLTATNETKNATRRLLERTYLEQLNVLLNPVKKELLNPVKTEKPTAADRASNSDVVLYMEQQMAKVETFCKQQAAQSSGINLLHYNDLLRQIKLIRERRETAK